MRSSWMKHDVTKSQMERLYITEEKTLDQISQDLGIPIPTLSAYLKRFKIQSRTAGDKLRKNLAGKHFGAWLVTDEKGYAEGNRHLRWKCLCTLCDEYYWVLARSLYSNTTTRCLNCHRNDRFKGYEGIDGTHWRAIQKGAAVRNIEFHLTIEQVNELYVAQDGLCALSGLPIWFGYKKEKNASLDRIDSSKAYTIDNVQWVHKNINRMKWDYTQSEFITYCGLVAKRQSINHVPKNELGVEYMKQSYNSVDDMLVDSVKLSHDNWNLIGFSKEANKPNMYDLSRFRVIAVYQRWTSGESELSLAS